MFTASPKLRVRSPSPTTVEFTVTTAPSNILTRQVVTWSTFLLRLLVCSSAVLLVLLKYYPPQTLTLSTHIHAYVHPLLQYISTALAARIPWQYLLPSAIAGLYIAIFIPGCTEESLLVIRDLGVQISTTTWGGRRSRFIPTSAVRDLWIHEGFCGFEVRFYLAVVVEGEEGVVVVFPVSSYSRRRWKRS